MGHVTRLHISQAGGGKIKVHLRGNTAVRREDEDRQSTTSLRGFSPHEVSKEVASEANVAVY